MELDVAFVGTGPSPDDPDRHGFGMAYRHAHGYQRLDQCELVACADIVPENAEAFANTFDITEVFEDHLEMLDSTDPDIVSVCVPPAAHADVVISSAKTGVPDAIHCEKPIAITWGGCQEMAQVCEEHEIRLTINHQRRFGTPFRRAKSLLDDGAIGDLERIEIAEANLFDAGTHLFDLCGYFTDQATPSWVLAQVQYQEENRWFGAHNENQAISQWEYEDGIHGVASCGDGRDFVGCYLRLRGSEGTIEIGVDDGPTLRLTNESAPTGRSVDTGNEDIHGPPSTGRLRAAVNRVAPMVPGVTEPTGPPSFIDRAIEDVVRSLEEDRQSELAAAYALQSTELIFASWESARRTGRVDLPLEIDDNPLEAMIESGRLEIS